MENQVVNDSYAIYNDDCMRVMGELPDKSVDFSVYSPANGGLYTLKSTLLSGSSPITLMQSSL